MFTFSTSDESKLLWRIKSCTDELQLMWQISTVAMNKKLLGWKIYTTNQKIYQVALLGRSNDHDESGDDVVSRDGDAEQEHRVEEASQVVDRVLKIPRRLINVRLLFCPCPKVNVNKLRISMQFSFKQWRSYTVKGMVRPHRGFTVQLNEWTRKS